ncbi:MAG: hypothetical protein WC058_12560, partial [Phycisphaeraceae bacterium]
MSGKTHPRQVNRKVAFFLLPHRGRLGGGALVTSSRCIAEMRKLLIYLNAMIRENKTWDQCIKCRNRSRVIAVFEPKTNVCRKMVEHWLVLPPFLKQNRGFLT